MNELIQLTQPVIEPVTVEECCIQLGLGVPLNDPQLYTQIQGLIRAARIHCEGETRSSYITRNWLFQRDGWPWVDGRYNHGGLYCTEFRLPQPPLQSLISLQYVDVDGNVQTLAQSTDYGSNPNDPIYGYQLDAGTDTKPARLLPPWAKPWPPTRSVANAVMVQFKSGFGGPVTASMAQGSPILTGPVFNPGDVGQQISVPGAGSLKQTLVTTIASVDVNGHATLAASAQFAVAASLSNVWAGMPVPENIKLAIKFAVQFFYEQGATTDLPMPRIVADQLSLNMNRVS